MKIIALEILSQLQIKKRDNETSFVCFKDSRQDWMQDIVRDVHSEMMPDDFKYKFFKESLEAIIENENFDDAIESLEPDIYNYDLYQWLSSNLSRAEYVNASIQELKGTDFDIFDVIRSGHLNEKREVFDLTYNLLQNFHNEIL